MLGGKSAVALLSDDEQCEPDITDSDRGDFRCWRAIDSSSSIMLALEILQSYIKPVYTSPCWID